MANGWFHGRVNILGFELAAVIFNGEQGWNVDLLKNRSEKLKPGLPLSLVRIFTQMATPGVNITKIFKHSTTAKHRPLNTDGSMSVYLQHINRVYNFLFLENLTAHVNTKP